MTKAQTLVAYLESKKGCPYVWGAQGEYKFDCSGLHYAGHHDAQTFIGIKPRTTADGYKHLSVPITWAQVQIGDPILFLGKSGTAYHIATYAGAGYAIEARGRAWGVIKYKLDDPVNGAMKRGGKPYHYPGLDLGELGEDDLNENQDRWLREIKLSTVADSFDRAIERAEHKGNVAEVARLEAKKTKDVNAKRIELGLTEAEAAALMVK